jgi:hypothetical protein
LPADIEEASGDALDDDRGASGTRAAD